MTCKGVYLICPELGKLRTWKYPRTTAEVHHGFLFRRGPRLCGRSPGRRFSCRAGRLVPRSEWSTREAADEAARAEIAGSQQRCCDIALAPSASVSAAEPDHHFDGAWDTVLSCENTAGAQGYSFKFPSVVKDGVLHGEKGTKGKPGWLQLDGKILTDGSAKIRSRNTALDR